MPLGQKQNRKRSGASLSNALLLGMLGRLFYYKVMTLPGTETQFKATDFHPEALLGSCVFPPPSLQLPSVPRLARVPLGPLSLRPHPRASLLGRWQLVTVLLLMVFSCCDSVSLSFEEGCCCCCC